MLSALNKADAVTIGSADEYLIEWGERKLLPTRSWTNALRCISLSVTMGTIKILSLSITLSLSNHGNNQNTRYTISLAVRSVYIIQVVEFDYCRIPNKIHLFLYECIIFNCTPVISHIDNYSQIKYTYIFLYTSLTCQLIPLHRYSYRRVLN